MPSLTGTAVPISLLLVNVLWRMVSDICVESMHTLTGAAVSKQKLSANLLWRVKYVICVENMHALTGTAVLNDDCRLTCFGE